MVSCQLPRLQNWHMPWTTEVWWPGWSLAVPWPFSLHCPSKGQYYHNESPGHAMMQLSRVTSPHINPMYIPTHPFPLIRLMSLESMYLNNTNLNPEWRLLRGQKPYLGLVPVCSLPPMWHHLVHTRSPRKYINLFWNSFELSCKYTKTRNTLKNPLYSFHTS